MLSEQQLKAFTALGDPALLLVSALAVMFYLWVNGDPYRLIRSWAVLSLMCVALTVAGKIACYLVQWGNLGPWRLHSPSGHVAIATAVYGGCATLLAAGRSYPKRMLIWVVTGAFVVALALSRLMLNLHSVAEVVVGLLIGLSCLAAFWLSQTPSHQKIVKASHLIALLLLVNVARFAQIDGEALVARVAKDIQLRLANGDVTVWHFLSQI